MALQHFYSRVPAKISMFNKADSFDTFACSENLDEELITAEISSVYDNKPTKDEVQLIRDGKISPVYFNYGDKEGRWMQSCMTFLPLDYTGERTSYLVHSLVMSDAEKKAILHCPDADLLNPELFVKSLDGFDITSFNSHADDEYPELKYKKKKSSGTEELVKNYDSDMLKRLIFAVISIACGNGKSVYVSVSDEIETCSEKILEFFNAFMQIFPYSIRNKIPFVTYTPDAAKYSDFKVKGIIESFAEIPASKGITLHMRHKIALGLQDKVVNAESFVVEFFYEMLCNDALRREFLSYCDGVCEKSSELASKMNTKNLRELVLLFCECSGLYEEKKILPNDESVHEFLSVYEKYRTSLSEEFRANAMSCLKRFPANHATIPPKTFTKITKMYPDETVASKRSIMATMLDLIHTDAMRAKLFTFLCSCYPDENEDTKKKITLDLCRVYYGGFLRNQILEFFDGVFAEEPEDCKNEIFEKILLTVRTESIKTQIFSFVEKYYSDFSAEQKEKLLFTYFENLPEGDKLAKEFSLLMEKYVESDKSIKKDFDERFCKAIEKEQRKKEHKIIIMLASGECKYLSALLQDKVYGEWSSKPVFDEYSDLVWQAGLSAGLSATVNALKIKSVDGATKEKLVEKAVENFKTNGKSASVTELVNMDKFVSENAEDGDLKDKLSEEAIASAIIGALPRVFVTAGGVEAIDEYKSAHPNIAKSAEFANIRIFKDMEKAFNKGDANTVISSVAKVENKKILATMITLLKNKNPVTPVDNAKIPSYIALELCGFMCENPSVSVSGAIENAIEWYGEGFENNCSAILTFMTVADAVVKAVPAESHDEVCDKFTEISAAVNNFKTANKSKGDSFIKNAVKNELDGIDEKLKGILEGAKGGAKQSWLKSLFSKK